MLQKLFCDRDQVSFFMGSSLRVISFASISHIIKIKIIHASHTHTLQSMKCACSTLHKMLIRCFTSCIFSFITPSCPRAGWAEANSLWGATENSEKIFFKIYQINPQKMGESAPPTLRPHSSAPLP